MARQIAAAERPADPSRLVVTSPPNPQNLQSEVSGDLAGLFLILALISLLIGAVGIANTTLVAVLERTEEIGLRRAVGARPRHIAAQFLAESTALGTLGGLIGTCLGVGDRGDLRRGQGLDRRAEPGLHAARAADRQRRRPAGGRLPRAARRADQPARRAAARLKGTMMRIRTGLADLLLRGPDRVHGQRAQGTGRDREHAERRQAAATLLGPGGAVPEAFTPYAALGQSDNDGLAPNESSYALAQACLTAAGYPDAGDVPFAISLGPANLAFSQPWGAWGYLGTAEAEQYGFRVPPGSALSALGIDVNPRPRTRPTSPRRSRPRSASAPRSTQDFTNAADNGTRWPGSRR